MIGPWETMDDLADALRRTAEGDQLLDSGLRARLLRDAARVVDAYEEARNGPAPWLHLPPEADPTLWTTRAMFADTALIPEGGYPTWVGIKPTVAFHPTGLRFSGPSGIRVHKAMIGDELVWEKMPPALVFGFVRGEEIEAFPPGLLRAIRRPCTANEPIRFEIDVPEDAVLRVRIAVLGHVQQKPPSEVIDG